MPDALKSELANVPSRKAGRTRQIGQQSPAPIHALFSGAWVGNREIASRHTMIASEVPR